MVTAACTMVIENNLGRNLENYLLKKVKYAHFCQLFCFQFLMHNGVVFLVKFV